MVTNKEKIKGREKKLNQNLVGHWKRNYSFVVTQNKNIQNHSKIVSKIS